MRQSLLSFRSAALLCALLCSVASANINLAVDGDTRRVVDLGVFGYSSGGKIELQVHELFIANPDYFVTATGHMHADEPIGFVLDLTSSAQSARFEKNYARGEGAEKRLCFINDPALAPADSKGRKLFALEGKKPAELKEADFSATITVPGLYALFFYNCKGFADKNQSVLPIVPVSFTAFATMYNVDSNGNRNYLSYSDRFLPQVYGAFAFIFLVLAGIWTRKLLSSSQHVHKVHTLMLFLLCVKSLSLVFESAKFAHFSHTGHPSVWDVFYYILLTVKGVMLFGILLLLGSGWSVMKAFLSEHDKKIMMIILPSQILINVCLAMIEESSEGNKSWASWSDLLQILDVICCCSVLLPIVWSIKNLRDAAAQDDKAARAISRMKQFRTFYIVVVAYIYFTRIVVVMVENSLAFDQLWLAKVAREGAAVAFYAYSGYKFQPQAENPYLHVDRDDSEEIQVRKEVAAAQHS